MFDPAPICPDELRCRRERTGEGLHEAKRALQREAIYAALFDLRERGSLEEKIDWLLDRYEETIT